MNGRKLNLVWKVEAKHSLYRSTGDWYHVLNRFPGALFDSEGYIRFKTRKDFKDCPYLLINEQTNTVHVPGGIRTIPGYNRML